MTQQTQMEPLTLFGDLTARLGLPRYAVEAGWWQVLDTSKDRMTKAAGLAEFYAMPYSTMMSRFRRAGLPTPKELLLGLRLIRVGQLLQTHDAEEVAYLLGFSARSAMARTLRNTRGVSVSEYRARFDLPLAIEAYCRAFLDPYKETWKTFDPTARQPSGRRRK